jgi:hypothetical protein
MIAAGSPGLRCKSEKTKIATTSMTGIVARIRRMRYESNGWPRYGNNRRRAARAIAARRR